MSEKHLDSRQKMLKAADEAKAELGTIVDELRDHARDLRLQVDTSSTPVKLLVAIYRARCLLERHRTLCDNIQMAYAALELTSLEILSEVRWNLGDTERWLDAAVNVLEADNNT